MQKRQSVEVVEPCLEIDEDLDLQERGWILQRVGWVFILSVMLAGGLGLFGEGILSKRTATSGNTKVEFEHFFRYDVEMKVLVQSSDHIASISFPQQYLKNLSIVRFVPQPVNNNTLNNTIRFNFLPADNHMVSIYLTPTDYGKISGTMIVNGTNNIKLDHFIYP